MIDLHLSGALLTFHHFLAALGGALMLISFSAIIQEWRRAIFPSPSAMAEKQKAKRSYSNDTKRVVRLHFKVLYSGISLLICGFGAPFVLIGYFVFTVVRTNYRLMQEA